MTWLKKFRDKFVEDCAQWWKMWSSWLAVLWGIIVAAVWTDPTVLVQLANSLPEEVRAMVSPFVFAIVSALPIIVRLLKQQKLVDAAKEKADKITD